MTSRTRFLRGVSTGWFSLGSIAVIQVWQIHLARTSLPNEEFALFGLISSVVATLLIAELGVRSAFARLLIDAMLRDEGSYRRFWTSTTVVFAVQGLIILIAALACAPFISNWFQIPESARSIATTIFITQSAITALQYSFGHHGVALLATQRFVTLNLYTTLAWIAGASLFWCGIKAGVGLWSYILFAIPSIVCNCVVFPSITKRAGISRSLSLEAVSRSEIAEIFRLGFDLFFVALYNLAVGNALLLFSGLYLPLALVSVLTVNLKFVQMLTQCLQRIPGTADPILSQMIAAGELSRFRDAWSLVSKVAIGLTAICVGLTYLWAGFAITLWTSKRDVLHGTELLLLSLLPFRYMVQMIYVLSATMFKAANKLRFPMMSELLVYAAVAFIPGKNFGLAGILLANLSSLVFGSLVPGLLLMARLSGTSPQTMIISACRTVFPSVIAAVALARLLPSPEMVSFLERTIWSVGWFSAIGAFVWFCDLTNDQCSRVMAMLVRRTKGTSG